MSVEYKEKLVFLDRKGTDCTKWDRLQENFGIDDAIAMWVADMDIKVPDCVQEALHKYVDQGAIGYMAPTDGYFQACIDWEYQHHGFLMKKEWIRFSPGVVSAFNWAVQLTTKKDDAVIVSTPVYYPFLNAITNNERKLITSDLINQDGSYSIDFKDFEEKIIANDVKAFILCSPHNPVGRVWTKEELKQLFEICRKHQVFVIADEIHQDLVYGENEQVPALSVGDYDDMMIDIMAPSKTFNLAGGQNSEVVIPDEKIRKAWDDFTTRIRIANGNSFGYIAAEAAYKGGACWLEAVKDVIMSNYHYLKDTLAKECPKIVVTPLQGTYLAWVDLRAYVNPEDTEEFMLKKCKIAPDFGEWFGGDRFKGFVRLNLATDPKYVKEAVANICSQLNS